MPRPRPTVGSTTGLTGTSGTSGGSPTISGGPVPAGSIIPASLKTTPTSPTGAGQVLGYDGTGFAWVAPGGSSAAVLTNRGVWAVSTSYAVGDVVVNGSTTYACTTSHTSGVTFSGTNWVALGSTAGGLASITITGTPSAGQVLQATSSTAATWVTPTSPQSTLGTIQTAASTPVTGRVNRYDASSGALSLTMPAVAAAGGSFSVQKTDSSTNTVTIGGVTLDKPKALVEFVSDGTVWAQVNASTGSPQTPDGGSGLGSVTVSGTPTAGQVLTASSGTAASWSTPASGAGDATTAAKGVVQLAGDLGGTASAPTVPGLAGKYTKPGPGIPATDLTAAVQSAVAAAGTAVQSVNGKTGTSVTLNASDVGAVASVVGQTGAVTGAQIAADPALTGTYAPIAEPVALAVDAAAVHKTGTETVAGVKTFSSSPVVPTPTAGDASTKAASTAYADLSSAAAAAGASLLLNYGQTAGAAKKPYEPAPAASANLWQVANFYQGATLGENTTALNKTTVSPTVTGTGVNTRLNTRVILPAYGSDNAILRYRLTFTLTMTAPSTFFLTWMAKNSGHTNIAVNGVGETTILSAPNVTMTGFRSTYEIDLATINGATYLDICMNVAASASGTATLSNVSLVQIEEVVPPILAGFAGSGAAPVSGSNFGVRQPIGLRPNGQVMYGSRSFGSDGATDGQLNGLSFAPYFAFQAPWSVATPTFGEYGPQVTGHVANNNQILSVYKADNVTTELRGNTHGGETLETGTYATDVQAFADYYDGNGWTQINDTGLHHRCWRVKLVVRTKMTRSDQGTPFCTVLNTWYLYADGTVRQDRTTTFSQDQKVGHWFWHMTSVDPVNVAGLGHVGKVGMGQKTLEQMVNGDRIAQPKQTSPAVSASGGTIPATSSITAAGMGSNAYRIKVTALSQFGETDADYFYTATTTGSTSSVTVNWTINNSALGVAPSGFNIYFGLAGQERLAGTVGAGVTTYTVTALPSPTAAICPNKNTAYTGGINGNVGIFESPYADWALLYYPAAEVVYSMAVDRDELLALTGVTGIRGTVQHFATTLKNYWHLRMGGATGNMPYTIPNGTVYATTNWFFTYVPSDLARPELEQTIRAANVKNLKGVYVSA